MTSQLKKIKWVRLLFLAQDKELETHDYIITAIVLYGIIIVIEKQ